MIAIRLASRACGTITLALAGAALCLVAPGCGSSSSTASTSSQAAFSNTKDFPAGGGRTMGQLIAGVQHGPVLAPTESILSPGVNRFAFGLFDASRAQITGVPMAVYVASATGANLRGPFPVRDESLAVAPPFQSQTVASDPVAAKEVDVAEVPFGPAKLQAVVALARVNGKLVASQPTGVQISNGVGGPPEVGGPAIIIHTPTVASVGGDVSKIDTRTPPDDMHAVDFAQVVGHKPTILLFATPQLCQSRVCGPVVDLAQELKSRYGNQVDFIHMEIYNDNQVNHGFRPQVAAYRLPTEPWLFAFDRHGKIVARIEGAFDAAELQQAIQKAISN